jgi:hypothetical protein
MDADSRHPADAQSSRPSLRGRRRDWARMTRRLVGLDEVLRVLADEGPLPSEAIARRFKLTPLDARILMLRAHAHSLVRTTRRGEWDITDRGCRAISQDRGGQQK